MVLVTRSRRRRRASWADLPEDMLGHVLRRLPSFADRARLRAVCRAWRAAWRRQTHPPAPWLVVPGHCVSLPDGAIHRVVPLPEDVRNARCIGSFGDWLALVPLASSGRGAPFLLNPFSAARIALPMWTDHDETIRKIVMSSAPDTSCIVAAMVDCGENRRRIAACRPGEGHERAWWPVSLASDDSDLQDIAFYEGRLHALTSCNKLVVFEDDELDGDPLQREPRTRRLHEAPPAASTDNYKSRWYLVECNGRLLRVARYLQPELRGILTIKVHALEPNDSWRSVKGIVGRALFVGDACSGSFPAAAAASPTSDDMIRENQVCFVNNETATSAELDKVGRPGLIRTVEAYDLSGQRSSRYRAGSLSGRTGRWHPERLFHSLWWNHEYSVVI